MTQIESTHIHRIELDKDIQPLSESCSKSKVLEDIKLAEKQIGKGLKISHKDVKKKFSQKKVQRRAIVNNKL